MRKYFSLLMILLLITNSAAVFASSVGASVVDAIAPDDQVSVEAGTSTSILVRFTVKGEQDGYATFKYVSEWGIENGALQPLNTDTVETPPKDADTVLEHDRVVYIKVAEDQEAGIFGLNIKAFDIKNSNTSGAKLGGGGSASYDVEVSEVEPEEPPVVDPEPEPDSQPEDVSAPVVVFEGKSPAANSKGWNKTEVRIPFTVSDDISGVKSVSHDGEVSFASEGAGQSQQVSAVDHAGNAAEYISPEVNIDMTPPQVEASLGSEPNAHGWFKNDVTVSFKAVDALSGIDRVDSPKTVSTEGYGVAVEGKAQDLAGNEGSASLNLNLDKTAPVISFSGIAQGAVLKLKQPVPVTWSAEDALSGIDASSGTIPSGANIDTASVGTKILTFSAIDKAGNESTVSISYRVVYQYSGILQPINNDGSSIFKLGSTVPTKFQLTDANGSFVATAVGKLYYSKVSDSVQGNVLEAASTSSATTGNLFRYDPASNQYIFNLSTKGLQTGTYKLTIVLDDGNSYEVRISLK